MGTVFLKLVNMSITAVWIILAAVVFRAVFKNAPKWIRCVLWAMAALRLVLPFSIESGISLVPSTETVKVETEEINGSVFFSDEDEGSDHVYLKKISLDSGIGVIDKTVSSVFGEDDGTIHLYVQKGEEQPMRAVEAAGTIWAIGAALMLLYAIVSYVSVKRRVRASVSDGGNVMICDGIESPFILGIIKPRIYLPSSLSADDKIHVTAHENAHIKRRDFLWKPLGFALLAVYWFNPFVWLAYILLCRDIELACDEKVIKDYDRQSRASYSQALLNCSIKRGTIAACPLAFGENGVKERVVKVLSYKKSAAVIIAAAALVCAGVFFFLFTDPESSYGKTGSSERLTLNGEIESVHVTEEHSGTELTFASKESTDALKAYFDNMHISDSFEEDPELYKGQSVYSEFRYKDGTVRRIEHRWKMFVRADEGKWYKIKSDDAPELDRLLNELTPHDLTDMLSNESFCAVFSNGTKISELLIAKKDGSYVLKGSETGKDDDFGYVIITGNEFYVLDFKKKTYSIETRAGNYYADLIKELESIKPVSFIEGEDESELTYELHSMIFTVKYRGKTPIKLSISVSMALDTQTTYDVEAMDIASLSREVPAELEFSLPDGFVEKEYSYMQNNYPIYAQYSGPVDVFVFQRYDGSFRCCAAMHSDDILTDKDLRELHVTSVYEMTRILEYLGEPTSSTTIYPVINPYGEGPKETQYSITTDDLREQFEEDYVYSPVYYDLKLTDTATLRNISAILYIPNVAESRFDEIEAKYNGLVSDLVEVLVENNGLPSGVHVNSFTKNGDVMTIDLNGAFGEAIQGGTTQETARTGALVNTLIRNCGVSHVIFTVNGETADNGHARYDFPLGFTYEIP